MQGLDGVSFFNRKAGRVQEAGDSLPANEDIERAPCWVSVQCDDLLIKPAGRLELLGEARRKGPWER